MREVIIISEEEQEDFKAYKRLVNKDSIIKITIKGLKEEDLLLASHWNGDSYTLENSFGKDILPEIKEIFKLYFDERLEELNCKLKELTLLKGEIEVLRKLSKEDDTREKKD